MYFTLKQERKCVQVGSHLEEHPSPAFLTQTQTIIYLTQIQKIIFLTQIQKIIFLTQISIFILKWYFFSRIFYPKTTFAPYENLDKCISDANLDNCVPNTSLDSYISDANLENYIIMSQTQTILFLTQTQRIIDVYFLRITPRLKKMIFEDLRKSN